MRFARRAATALAVAGLATGCATRTVKTPTSNDATTGGTATVLTAHELSRLASQGSLMDALERLRPSMLVSRGTAPPWVSIDGSPLGELSLLRTIAASMVREVRLQRASSGAGRPVIAPNGGVIIGDVIAVTTWEGGRPRR